MQDSEIVAAVVAGDPAGLAAAYDRYAAALHAYCRAMLTEPADAADVVQDTFVIAAAKLAGLRDRSRLRPWLYAVARNECHRRLRARASSVPLEEAGEVTATGPEAGAAVERADLRALVADALAGLNPGERELIELNLRHELHGADLADAIGVPLNQAHALASRARGQFETSLGALLVARSGRESCAELNGMLAGWDGHLTVLLRKRLNRHIERCAVCGERKRRELNPALLLGMLPPIILPPALRAQVFRLVADVTELGAAHRAHIVRRAEPFRRSGFPRPARVPGQPRLAHRTLLTGTAAAAFALLAGALLTVGLLHSAPRADSMRRVTPPATHGASASLSPVPTPAGSSSASLPASPSASPSATSAPATQPPVTPTSPSPTPSPSPGTLSETPSGITLQQPPTGGAPSGSFTLTAVGGPVASYSIAVPARYEDDGLSVTPVSGSLAAGQSVTVTVTWAGAFPISLNLGVTPGGAQVSVSYQPIQ